MLLLINKPPDPSSKSSVSENEKRLVLFDGYCRFCNWAVSLILRFDSHDSFRLAPLPENPQAIAQEKPMISNVEDSILLIDGDQVLTESDALLGILTKLSRPLSFLRVLRIIPRAWRNAAYRWFAHNRHRIFTRRQHCVLPPLRLIHKFQKPVSLPQDKINAMSRLPSTEKV